MAAEMKLITDITLELTGETKRFEVQAKQGDKGTRFVRVSLTNNGAEFEMPSGVTVIANIQKPDRKFCFNECTLEENKVLVPLTNQALAVAGTAECDIEIRDGGGNLILSSQAFTIEIEKSMRDENAIESSNEFTALEKINAAEEARVKAEAARVTAENKRASAETSRASAETERQKQLALMKTATTDADNAKNAALQAKQQAETAASGANTAKKAADDAADAADAAAQRATQAASGVEEATQSANDAAAAANSAKDAANTAAANTNAAIAGANSAKAAAEAAAEACEGIAAGINTIPDLATGKVYTIGIQNGIAYLEEVVE